MARSTTLSYVGREELKMWQTGKMLSLALIVVGSAFFLIPYIALGNNPYVIFAIAVGVMCAFYMWMFALLIFIGSLPCVIHKVNGVWVMKR